MKITLISLLAIAINVTAFGQEIKFDIQYSEPLAVFQFVQNLSGKYPINSFKKVFQSSKYNTEKYQNLIATFDKINYFYWYDYPQYPYGSKIGGNTYFILNRNLIGSKSLDEFARRSFGIIPNADLNKLVTILTEMQPVYQEIVFVPSEVKFKAQLSNIKRLISSTDIDKLFNQAKHFHRSNWNNTVPFVLNLYPIPDNRAKGFSATAFFNYAIAGIPNGLTDYELLLSVMFHEAFHILYDEQSLVVKQDIADWFHNNSSKMSTYAGLLFNEAVTTAIANGYLFKELKGELLTDDWYNNPYIAGMAEAMYPLVVDYLDSGKQIDQNFIDRYIELFENNFPEWFTDVDHVMMQRSIVAEDQEDFASIRNKFRFNNITEYNDELTALSLEKMKSHPVTKLIVVKDEHEAKLNLIKDNFSELKDWQFDPTQDFVHSELLGDKTYLIVLNSVKKPVNEHLEGISIDKTSALD